MLAQEIVLELTLPIVIVYVKLVPAVGAPAEVTVMGFVVVFVALIPTVGVEVVPVLKNPPRARYRVLARITVMATRSIVAIIGDTASSFSITGFSPFAVMVREDTNNYTYTLPI